MEVIDSALLDEVIQRAKTSPRLRMNYNFHDRLDAPVSRMLNAMEKGTYVSVHRHLNPPKDESVVVLRGRAASFVFDDAGEVTEAVVVDPRDGVYGFDIKAGTWHGLLVLEDRTVLYEAKEGPYVPIALTDVAPWTPAPDDAEGVARFLARLENYVKKNLKP